MAERNLDELKGKLWGAFDRVFLYDDGKYLIAVGAIAQAIVAVEREQREAKGGFFKLEGK